MTIVVALQEVVEKVDDVPGFKRDFQPFLPDLR
jgi:hypothetical protein